MAGWWRTTFPSLCKVGREGTPTIYHICMALGTGVYTRVTCAADVRLRFGSYGAQFAFGACFASVRWTKLKLTGREDSGKAAETKRCNKINDGLEFCAAWKVQNLDNSGNIFP